MDISVVKWHRYRWSHLSSPIDEKEVKWLKKEFGFSDLDLEDCASAKTLRPKWEKHDDHSFFIFHFANLNLKGRLEVQELKLFVGENFLVTIANDNLKVKEWHSKLTRPTVNLNVERSNLQDFSQEGIENDFLVGNPGRLMYELVDRLTDNGLVTVRKLGLMIDELDEKMSNLDKKAIEDGSAMRRNLILYLTTLKPMVKIFNNLEKTNAGYLNGKLGEYWGNISDHLKQSYDTLIDYSELLDGLTASFDVLLTKKTNDTIKVLTVFSVLFLPLTLLSGIYGMNVGLPFSGQEDAFWMILGLMGVMLAGFLGFFRIKKWI